jgi:hypothetical protein
MMRDRRRIRRGGRRREDALDLAAFTTAISCLACHAGTAVIMAFSTDGEHEWLTYRCNDCDHRQFYQLTE